MTRETLPSRRMAETMEFTVGNTLYTANLGYYPDGRLGEVFLYAGKAGTDVHVASRDSAIAVSFALQFGCDVETIRSSFTRDSNGNPEGPLGVLFDMLSEGS